MTIICPAEAAVERLNAGVIARVLPAPILDGALGIAPRARRRRKLPDRFMLLFCVLMGFYADTALPHVLRRIIGPQAAGADGATAGALCQARYRLGARPVVALFRAACRPLAIPTTPGAFLFGRRLMALDGTTIELPDTPANVSVFGRRRTPRGTSAWGSGPARPTSAGRVAACCARSARGYCCCGTAASRMWRWSRRLRRAGPTSSAASPPPSRRSWCGR